jgi:hypothetical protein
MHHEILDTLFFFKKKKREEKRLDTYSKVSAHLSSFSVFLVEIRKERRKETNAQTYVKPFNFIFFIPILLFAAEQRYPFLVVIDTMERSFPF